MVKVGSYEAKTHLPRLLNRVAHGERITITKHGVPVAMLVPVQSATEKDVQQAIEEMKTFSRGRRLGDLSIRDMIEEGRR